MYSLLFVGISAIFLSVFALEFPLEVTSIWDDLRLDMRESSEVEKFHLVESDSSGTFVCFWEEKKSSNMKCIKALRFSSTGNILGAVKEIVQFPDKGAFAKVYGSGRGNYLLLLAQKEYRMEITARRLLADLNFRESFPILVCKTYDTINPVLKGTIDNNDLVVIALHEDDKEDQRRDLTKLRVFYLNRSGLVDSLALSTNNEDEHLYRALDECVLSEGNKVTLFFNSYKVDAFNKEMIYSRVLSYSSNTLEWKTDYNKIKEVEYEAFLLDMINGATGRYDYPGSIAIIRMPFATQPMLLYLDSIGKTVESFSLGLTNYLGNFKIGSGFNGAYGYIASQSEDSMWIHWTDVNKHKDIPPLQPGQFMLIKGGEPAGICLDELNRPIISWTRGKSLYLGYILENNLRCWRVNGIEDKPVMSKCALSYGGRNRVAAWRIGGVDSIYLCGWIGKERNSNDETRNTFTQVYSDSGVFSLKLSGDTAIMIYNNNDNLKMLLRNVKNNTNINLSGVNDNGSKGSKPSFTVDSNKIVVVWEDRRPIHGDTPYIYFQTFDRGGIPIGSNVALSVGENPSIQQMDNERYFITFHYSTQTTTNVGGIPVVKTVSYVYGMIVNKNGSINLEPIRLNPQSNGGSNVKIVSFYEEGKNLIVWLETSVNMTSRRIYGCIIDNSGKIEKSAFSITSDSSITDFDLCKIDGYKALLCWHNQDGGKIKAVMLNYNGIPIVDQWTVSNRALNSDVPVSLSVSASDSAAFISWID